MQRQNSFSSHISSSSVDSMNEFFLDDVHDKMEVSQNQIKELSRKRADIKSIVNAEASEYQMWLKQFDRRIEIYLKRLANV